jgi:hypothetical protein
MDNRFKTAALAALLAAVAGAASASPHAQLAASAGLSPSVAAGLTLAQIAAHKANRGESLQDRQTIPGTVTPGDAGPAATRGLQASARNMPGLSLRELAAVQANRGESDADKITVTTPTPGVGGGRSQLAASARLGADGADGRSLTEIAAHFFNRGESEADKQTVRN